MQLNPPSVLVHVALPSEQLLAELLAHSSMSVREGEGKEGREEESRMELGGRREVPEERREAGEEGNGEGA